MRGSWGEELTSEGNFIPSYKCPLTGAGTGLTGPGWVSWWQVNWGLLTLSTRLSLPPKSSWNSNQLHIFRSRLHQLSVNVPLCWSWTYFWLWTISELGGEKGDGGKKGMETNTLFSLLLRVDLNSTLEEAKAMILDYFKFSVAWLITMEHLRISWRVSKLCIWLNTLLKKQHVYFRLWLQLVFTVGIFSNLHAQLLGSLQLFAAPWTVARQAPLSMGFSRQEYWSGLPCPPPGIEPTSLACPALAGKFFTTNTTWEAP